jgi:hypothetical protein
MHGSGCEHGSGAAHGCFALGSSHGRHGRSMLIRVDAVGMVEIPAGFGGGYLGQAFGGLVPAVHAIARGRGDSNYRNTSKPRDGKGFRKPPEARHRVDTIACRAIYPVPWPPVVRYICRKGPADGITRRWELAERCLAALDPDAAHLRTRDVSSHGRSWGLGSRVQASYHAQPDESADSLELLGNVAARHPATPTRPGRTPVRPNVTGPDAAADTSRSTGWRPARTSSRESWAMSRSDDFPVCRGGDADPGFADARPKRGGAESNMMGRSGSDLLHGRHDQDTRCN